MADLFPLTVLLLSARTILAQVTCTVSPKINCFADFTDGKTRLFTSDVEISGKVTYYCYWLVMLLLFFFPYASDAYVCLLPISIARFSLRVPMS